MYVDIHPDLSDIDGGKIFLFLPLTEWSNCMNESRSYRSLTPGKVVIVLSGKYAGRKAVIVKVHERGTKTRPYGHCIIAGIDRYPLKVTRSMSQEAIKKRTTVKPFIKVINLTHLLPTRYKLELAMPDISLEAPEEDLKSIKKSFEDRYRSGQNMWFFTKLRF
ncbi:hypothetical protein GEMRC1_008457 [Eukaryota sp. GEM-RC1]